MKIYRLQVKAENDLKQFLFLLIHFFLYYFYVQLQALFDILQPSALINHLILTYCLLSTAVMTQFTYSAH